MGWEVEATEHSRCLGPDWKSVRELSPHATLWKLKIAGRDVERIEGAHARQDVLKLQKK
jgi:hypothetical protein